VIEQQSVNPPPPNAIGLADPLNAGMGSRWASWNTGVGSVTSTATIGFRVVAAASAPNSYGGFQSLSTYDLTGRYCYIWVQQPLTRVAGCVQTLQLQINSNNYLEIGLVDASLMARINVAGSLTTLASIAWPSLTFGDLFVSIAEVSGTITFRYATSANQPDWQVVTTVANPFAITALYVNLTAGTYAAVASPGVAVWNSVNWVILPSPLNVGGASIKPQALSTSAALLTTPPPVPLAGATVAQGSSSALVNLRPPMSGTSQAQASTTAQLAISGQFAGATVTRAQSTAALAANLAASSVAQAQSSGTATKGPAMTGLIATQAISTGAQLVFGLVFLPNTSVMSLGSTICQALVLTRYPLSGISVGQGSTTTLLGQANAVVADIGVWPAGAYAVKTCCRTDATGAPAALVFAVTVAGSVVVTTNLYAAGDTASATYPTAYASYAGSCLFNLNVPSDVAFQWSNPGTYHAAGKHLWIKGAQLHRLS
jgi:hypothetical protein